MAVRVHWSKLGGGVVTKKACGVGPVGSICGGTEDAQLSCRFPVPSCRFLQGFFDAYKVE